MYKGKKVVIVMPAYNASQTLQQTVDEIPKDIVDEIVLVDDNSPDDTVDIAKKIGLKYIIKHEKNLGYGGNQKTCYNKALELKADIVIMLHPDYQYTPKLLTSIISLLGEDLYSVVFASRILGKGALEGGMPMYKYIANRFLTFTQNILINQKLSEYHTGYRGYTSEVLKTIDFNKCDNDFVFDNEIIAQICDKGFKIGEISCPTKYFPEASSINFKRSVTYGMGVLRVSIRYFLHQVHILNWKLLDK